MAAARIPGGRWTSSLRLRAPLAAAILVAAASAAVAQNLGAGSADPSDEAIQAAAVEALPFLVAGLVLMAVVASRTLANSVASPSVRAPLPVDQGAPLPEHLRVVSLPGVAYAVESVSGMVLEKETTVRTTVSTTTTAGEAYRVGDVVHVTPGATQTTVSDRRHDLFWLKNSAGRESSYTFTDAAFQARRGQIVSIVSRRREKGDAEPLFAFNHATGQLELLPGNAEAHKPRLLPAWFAATFAGSLAFGAAVWVFVRIAPEREGGVSALLSNWMMGGFVALIPAFVVLSIVHRRVAGRRAAAFRDRYLPEFRAHFERSTPNLAARLA
jgi:DMSO/TMAO reductase YedYZ heme-binding membrane subunit